ncbi:SGNH/GDSL hydrolase family protein [Paenibacillus sp. HJGM_3]|uniref:SGNH/GDSL hydrolase family protein n=1 Tax=Paenibacillus sp. HJGM_3 TaxID=3379816 RepID=UPI00385F4347
METHADNPRPRPLYTFNDAWTEWLAGGKFPIAFFGDSTIDGANTTGWVRNTIGADNVSPNAFSRKLERLLREAADNTQLRVYNAGFSGQVSSWAVTVIDDVFGPESPYCDVKMMGIGFGINDRLGYENEKAYRLGFKANITHLIEWCYAQGIQPFLLTTQATLEPGVWTQYVQDYPMRTSGHIDSIANEVKRELAVEYGLQLIDVNRYTEQFLLYSSHSAKHIISDRLHFGDIGHQFEAELLFAHIVPRTVVADSFTKLDLSSQHLFRSVPEDWLTLPEKPADSFKVYVDHTLEEAEDRPILSAWVFVLAKHPLVLRAYKHDSPDTYVRINGKARTLTGPETLLGELDMGLYKLEGCSGVSMRVDFKGFTLE